MMAWSMASIDQEFGYVHTSGKHITGKPFMRPAIEHIRPAFERGWKQIIEKQTITPDDFVEKLARDAEGVAKAEAPYRTGNLKASIQVSTPEEFGV